MIICSTEQRPDAVSVGTRRSASHTGFTARRCGRLESFPDKSHWWWRIASPVRGIAVLNYFQILVHVLLWVFTSLFIHFLRWWSIPVTYVLLYSVFINYSLTWEWNKTRFCVHVVFLTGFCHCTYAYHTIFCCQIYSVTFNERTVKVWTTPNCCLTVWCCDCYWHISINVSYWALIVMYKCSFKTLLWYISCNNRYFRTYFLLQYL